MGKTLQQAWLAFTTAFIALEVLMRAVLHLCTWAEATAGAFEDEASDDRKAKAAARRLSMGVIEAPVPAIEVQAS